MGEFATHEYNERGKMYQIESKSKSAASLRNPNKEVDKVDIDQNTGLKIGQR